MQRDSKNIGNVASSSLIDLKAELFRKQEDFKNQKLKSQSGTYVKGKSSGAVNKKPNIFSKRNAGVVQRAEKDYEEKKEEENVFDKSRRALENKARLYEKITSGSEIPEEDGSDIYLVDFQKKVIENVAERREKDKQEAEDRERREAEEDRQMLQMPVPAAETEEEEWVDFVDSFGRSRRCLRKDLKKLQSEDRKTGLEKSNKNMNTPNLLSDDMRREMERQKWEKDEIEKMEKEKEVPIHYANVRHNEVRTHGVGYYQFDKAEDARQEQMEQLLKLREETKDERSKTERIKEKRKAALAARLAKVKQRKREKLGIIEDEEDKADSDVEVGPKLSEIIAEPKEPERLTRDDKWRQTAELTREWDKGKERSMERSEQAWLEKQRAERETEFAPPSFYYEDRKQNAQTFSGKNTVKKERESEFAPPSFYHEDRKTNKRTFRDTQNDASNASYTQTKNVKTENVAASDESVKKSSEILASVIMNKLKDYRNKDEVISISQGATEVSCKDHSKAHATMQSEMYHMDTIGIQNNAATFQDTSVPPPNFQAFHPNFQESPKNFQPTPPNYQALCPSMPPPNFNIPPPTTNVHQPNINAPPPNFSVPPPNMNISYPYFPQSNINTSVPLPPPQNFQVNSEHVPSTDYSLQGQSCSPYIGQTNQVVAQNQNAGLSGTVQSQPKKVIPKMDILDRRLMPNNDD